MKRNYLFLSLLFIVGCNSKTPDSSLLSTNESSSEESTAKESSSTKDDSSTVVESQSSSDESSSIIEYINIDIPGEGVVATYKESFTMEKNNYLVLNSEGKLVYLTDNDGIEIKSSLFSNDLIKSNKFTLNNNNVGYKINDDTMQVLCDDIDNPNATIITILNKKIEIRNKQAFRLSSIHDYSDADGVVAYKVISPYDDTYTLSCSKATSLEVLDTNFNILASGTTSLNVNLDKEEAVYVKIVSPTNAVFDLTTSAKTHKVELPYEIVEDNEEYATTGSTTISPTKAVNVKYTKRNDSKGLYVNCNNPEALTTSELNKCLTKQDVSNKDVFFTFEHNNMSTNFYYGYRVTNNSKEDAYITVKNLGYQYKGAGTWLGEDEWVKFYNISFRSKTDFGSSSANSNLDAYVGFANTYTSANRKPITYRLPAGKYIYVMGGTTADAYDKINVFSSANQTVNGGCSNGAVLFNVTGSNVLGQFVVYNNVSTLANNINNETGYMVTRGGKSVGSQYVGYDDCHGVVDAKFTWVFNDKTSGGSLPISYSNPYYTTAQKGTAYAKITNFTKKTNTTNDWVTHINPNNTAEAVGTDMTFYKTIKNGTNEEITIDYLHYDGKGNVSNIGNWMVDYQDHFTLVNQGNKEREFTYKLTHNGVILAFIRNEDGMVDTSFSPKYFIKIAASNYGAACEDLFIYKVKVPAHSVKKFVVDYNLLANSCGYIKHETNLSS